MSLTIAILAKDKAHCLPYYLKALYNQSYSKSSICLYIRTNDNKDDTSDILRKWIDTHGHLYKEVYFNNDSINDQIKNYKPHEWNALRFEILGKIRQESIEWAIKKETNYFVADCDNFLINPETLEILSKNNLPIVAPFLITSSTYYSNYHHTVDDKGYFVKNPEYMSIYEGKIKGLIEVDLVHCTYFIMNEYLINISYLSDGSNRHEYVIFSANLRDKDIKQYLDNRDIYGYITFHDDIIGLKTEDWLINFINN